MTSTAQRPLAAVRTHRLLFALWLCLAGLELVVTLAGGGRWGPGPARGLAADLLALAGLALAAWRPTVGAALVLTGLAAAAATPSDDVGTAVYVAPVLVGHLAAWDRRRHAWVLTAGGWAVGLWSSRRAHGPGQWAAAEGLWTALYLLAWAVGRWERQRQRATRRQLDHALEDLRLQVARELHDTVAHDLALIVMRAHQAQLHPAGAGDELEFIAHRATQANLHLRRLMTLMRPGQPEVASGLPEALEAARGLPEALEAARDELRRAGAEPRTEVDGDLAAVPRHVADCAARLVREAVNNMVRHGDPDGPCVVLAAVSPGRLDLGFTNAVRATGRTGHAPGLGLVGMRERVAAVGGSLHAGAVGDTWVVRASLPWLLDPVPGDRPTQQVEHQLGAAVHPGTAAQLRQDLLDR